MSKIKVMHLATSISASSASYRIHSSLNSHGMESLFGTLSTDVSDPTVQTFVGKIGKLLSPFGKVPDYILSHLYRKKAVSLFSSELFPSLYYLNVTKFPVDILNLHWIAGNFLPPLVLRALSKPVVWTLHDTWAFTGGCHILKGCSRYQEGCGKCPQLGSTLATDLSSISWRNKSNVYKKLNPIIVSPSRYIYDLAKRSALLSGFRIKHIPNCIDTEKYYPVQQALARNLLGLPQDKKIVLFGAMAATSDPNKGYDLLFSALQVLKHSGEKNIYCVVFGAAYGDPLPFPTHYLGILHDSVSINLAYNAADVFVCPSREENFPNTVLESLSTGTPIAAFAIGGIPDMVSHMESGYLAPAYDTKELAKGIASILHDDVYRDDMGTAARRTVEKQYANDIVAEQYFQLYESVLNNKV